MMMKQQKSITGYQIQYSTNKNFQEKTTIAKTVKNKFATKCKINKLKENKKYYIRVRTYKTVKKENYYSKWSAIGVVTTKK